ncbi:phosphatase PAP2 family protein [Pseudonocardia humida]
MAELLDRPGPSRPQAPAPRPGADPDATTEQVVVPPAPAEVRVLEAVQQRMGRPPVVRAATGMSHFGEHAMGWLAIGAAGALLDRRRRREWVAATAGVALAHGASVGVKRVVRRPRPDHERVRVLVGTPSKLSFPSAHATSTAAAAVLLGPLLGRPGRLVTAAVAPMALSRMVLGVHYPTDVLAGTALGAAVGLFTRRLSAREGRR